MRPTNKSKKWKQRKYPVSLTEAAEELGVSVPHLSRVLRRKRISKSLTNRYRQLVEDRQAA